MKIKKRNGTEEEISLSKIEDRINNLLSINNVIIDVDVSRITTKVVEGIYDGVSSNELDSLASETAISLSTENLNYGELASRIEISSLHKNTGNLTFSERSSILFSEGRISESHFKYVNDNSNILNSAIDYSRDYHMDFFGIKTLKKSYLLKSKTGEILERPQDMIMRVASFIYKDNIIDIIEAYDLMSTKHFTYATPTLFNAGTNSPQLSSCFLLDIHDDSIGGIYKTLSDCAKISQHAGGIGLSIHSIRGKGSFINGTGGVSNGIVPMLNVFNSTARYVDQGGNKRKGAIAIYIEPWHSDIFEFLDLKKNQGKDEIRARDLFYGLWIPDLFMKRVEEDSSWSLFSPDKASNLHELFGDEFDKEYLRLESNKKESTVVSARDLWYKILESQIETGTPYMLYKDAANKKSNQKNLGTIKSSNLCVSGDTNILTSIGNKSINYFENKYVPIWNGKEWSTVKIVKTGTNVELLKIKFSDGAELKCTPYHKFYTKNNYFKKQIEVRAEDLIIGDKMIKFIAPVVANCTEIDIIDYYTHGAFCADGTWNNKKPTLALYSYKKDLINELDIKSSSYKEDSSGRINCMLNEMNPKNHVPSNASIHCRLEWFAGLTDFDGCLTSNKGTQSIQIASIDNKFLNDIRMMLLTIGVRSKVVHAHNERDTLLPDGKGRKKYFHTKECWRILIAESGIQKLLSLGINFRRIKPNTRTPNREASQFVKVVSIEKCDNEDTYCFTEKKRGMGVFNGVLTGQCCEILEYTSKDEIAVCNLGSISLPQFLYKNEDGVTEFNYNKLIDVVSLLTRGLDNVIDMNRYPVEEARNSNLRHRPIGIGVQGLADLFAILKIAFDSEEAKELNRRIFEVLYYGAIKESITLAKEKGTYESYKGSPAESGKLQFDLWGKEDDILLDWSDIYNELSKHGLRNSLLCAPMPTASTSQILGNNEAIEPYTSNIYTRRTMSGEFVVINKHLVRELIELGIWSVHVKNAIIEDRGSIQGLFGIPKDIKHRYRTVWEMKMKDIIDMSADRAPFICQSQSLNLFVENPTYENLSSMHFYSWKKGLKTGMYYLRIKPKANAKQFSLENKEPKYTITESEEVCESCSG